MTHIWLLTLLLIALSRAEQQSNPAYLAEKINEDQDQKNQDTLGAARIRGHPLLERLNQHHPHDSLISGGIGGGPFGHHGHHGGPFGDGHHGLISGIGSGGPFVSNTYEDGVASSLLNAGISGGSFGNGNLGIVSGKVGGGPFTLNRNKEGTLNHDVSWKPLDLQAENTLVKGGISKGPLISGNVVVVPKIRVGGSLVTNNNKDGQLSEFAGGKTIEQIFGNEILKLISGDDSFLRPFINTLKQDSDTSSSVSGVPFKDETIKAISGQ